MSALCRQVLAACKDDADTLLHLSRLARGGHSTHGRGVVRLLFRSADAAEQFVRRGYAALGEATYVRWPELQPQEMGPELYAELLRLSTEYRPDAKMLVYVAVCVVSVEILDICVSESCLNSTIFIWIKLVLNGKECSI